jgi:chorismate lyase/3-hydroxybenzoate synthase
MQPIRVTCQPDTQKLETHTLALVRYGDPSVSDNDPRRIDVPLETLASHQCELWRSPTPVRTGNDNGFHWAENDQVLMGHILVGDRELTQTHAIARSLYEKLDQFLQTRGYPHLLRAWNYFNDIHRGGGDNERYKLFVAGRYEAFAAKPHFEASAPAATAIGTQEPGLLLYFLAGKTPGVQVENPRQLSAFKYPREHGARSPSFSRSTLISSESGAMLLVSGTASIVGHASKHPGDASAQLEEILGNLSALLNAAEAQLGDSDNAWRVDVMKLYLRHSSHRLLLEERLRMAFGKDLSLITLQGDICRSELLAEVEAVFSRVPRF